MLSELTLSSVDFHISKCTKSTGAEVTCDNLLIFTVFNYCKLNFGCVLLV